MWFLTAVVWLSYLVQVSFFTLALAAGLYYLAEFVEEYTMMACKLIKYMILVVIVIYIGLLLLEDFPKSMLLLGLCTQIVHLSLLRTFPVLVLLSPSSLLAVILLIANHYLAFSYFGSEFHEFSEVMAYFTICLWLIPFAFFVSLSANDNTLPFVNIPSSTSTYGTVVGGFDDTSRGNDLVSNYFSSRKQKKYGLLALFNYCKEFAFPERSKRFA